MRTFLLALLCGVLAGCSSDGTSLNNNGGNDGGTNLTGDEDDPIVCIGDPDRQVICGRASEMWDCAEMPNGEIKCGNKHPQVPADVPGGGSWDCKVVGDEAVCTTDTPDVDGNLDGAGGWTCTSDDVSTTCKKDVPVPPGGGTYDCNYGDGEFVIECTGEDAPPPPPPTEPPPGQPPTGGGAIICYVLDPSYGDVPLPPEGYWAKLMGEKVLYNGEPALHIKLWLSKAFVDNTYGDYSIGYSGGAQIGGGHSLGDLLESDKMEVFVPDTKGNLVFHMALDYFSKMEGTSSGYGSLGVSGGDGKMLMGDESDILATQTSLAVNFNGHGYVLEKNSPKTDMNFTPDPAYPKWIFDVWYEAWIKWSAFGDTGPGKVYITGLHASPNKSSEKKPLVVPGECP